MTTCKNSRLIRFTGNLADRNTVGKGSTMATARETESEGINGCPKGESLLQKEAVGVRVYGAG